MRPGFLIPVWHNYLKYRLTASLGRYEIWRHIGFGLWVMDHIVTGIEPERAVRYFYEYAGDHS